MVQVLGVEAPPDLVTAWTGWLAPDPQPFVVGPEERWTEFADGTGTITPELRDTFRLWAATEGSRLVWISEAGFRALPPSARRDLVREQVARRNGNRAGVGQVPTVRRWRDLLGAARLRAEADGHRFVWWPSLVHTDPAAVLTRLLATDRLPSRHSEVSDPTWARAAGVLPEARRLAGTWPAGSTACCFSTVMAAAGADDRDACLSLEPFAEWLAASCRRGGDPERPGTVLVWRDRSGEPVHAAVTIGDGWALEKPSQEWHSPIAVAAVADVVRTSRAVGQRLERHTIR